MAYLNNTALNTQISYVKSYISAEIQNAKLYPIGIIKAFSSFIIPNGWLLCDGSAISRTTYANLYNVIGTTYGTGNGSTTFNLPDLTNRFIEGSTTAGTVKTAGLPNITGNFRPYGEGSVTVNGAFYVISGTEPGWGTTSGIDYNNALIDFDASRSSSIYGNSTTVQPPSVSMLYMIKY